MDVPALEASLAEAVRYQPLIELLTSRGQPPLTVVCEGRASTTRAEFGVHFDVTPYGQHGVAARLTVKTPYLYRPPMVRRRRILRFFAVVAALGNSVVALVWSVPEARASEVLALAPGRIHRKAGNHASRGPWASCH